MSELGEVRAQNVVASGNGWSVGRGADGGFNVRIDRASGTGWYGTDVAYPGNDAEREEAKDRLLDTTTEAVELDRIEEAFAAPWVQA